MSTNQTPQLPSKIEFDGSFGEGGGAILRVGSGLACVKHVTFHINNIRKNRPQPGLKTQHLIGIQALNELTQGVLTPVQVGSTELEFSPGNAWKQQLNLQVSTAGNIGLLLQSLHNGLYNATIPSCRIHIKGGGTYGTAAPGIFFLENVTYALFRQLGYSVDLQVLNHGFYPKGGADVIAEIFPNPAGYKGLNLLSRGNLLSIEGKIVVEERLRDRQVGERIQQNVLKHLNRTFLSNIQPNLTLEYVPSLSTGVGVDLWAKYDSGAILGCGTQLGERNVSSETVGKNAAFAMNKVLESECTVDNYTADQLLPLLVLAKEPSKFIIDEITSHTQTNLELIQKFIPRQYRTSPVRKGFLIEYL